jgi:hypothetical protein
MKRKCRFMLRNAPTGERPFKQCLTGIGDPSGKAQIELVTLLETHTE